MNRQEPGYKESIKSETHHYAYLICSKFFPQGDDRKVIFKVMQTGTGRHFTISAFSLFQNEALLGKFSPQDIRDIVYTAAWEIFLLDKENEKSWKLNSSDEHLLAGNNPELNIH